MFHDGQPPEGRAVGPRYIRKVMDGLHGLTVASSETHILTKDESGPLGPSDAVLGNTK